MAISDGITYFREKANLTIEELAEKARISKTTIVKAESDPKSITHASLQVIANALNVSPDDLLKYEPFNPSKGFGHKIRVCRQNKFLSQEQLGELVGVSRQQIAGWEKELILPSRLQAEKLSGALQTHFRVLFPTNTSISQSQLTNDLTSLIQEAIPRDAMEFELLRLWRQVDQKWKLRCLYFLTGDDFYFEELNKLIDKLNVTDLDSHRLLREMRHRLK